LGYTREDQGNVPLSVRLIAPVDLKLFSLRQDAQTQSRQTQLNDLVDNRIEKKLISVGDQLRGKADGTTVKKESSDLHEEMVKGFEAIHSDIEKGNALIRETREETAKLNGRVDGIDKNVDRLINLQLRSAASLPPDALAPQVANVYALYQVAEQRNVPISNEINNLLRVKLASAEASQSDFWPLASKVITRASQAAVGQNLTTSQTIQNVFIEHNTFRGARVVLDRVHFISNLFDQCVVEYHGGPTDTRNNVFRNCLFIISIAAIPPEDGQKTVRTLLASSNLRSVVL